MIYGLTSSPTGAMADSFVEKVNFIMDRSDGTRLVRDAIRDTAILMCRPEIG